MTKEEAARAKQRKAGLALAHSLERSAKAMNEFLHACVPVGAGATRDDDGRLLLLASMQEYACYLDSVFGLE